MKKYIELKITGKPEAMVAYVEKLKGFASDAFKFADLREDNILRGGFYVEFLAKRPVDYRSRVILIWDEKSIRICNIVPKTVSFLEVEQYNAVLRHFYEDVIGHTNTTALNVAISKEENAMKDLISAPAYRALELWEDLCNKNSPTTHPNDRERWMDFICELYINDDHLSLSDFRNWLIEDKGWYYDANDEDDRTFLDMELDLEFGLDLIAHYAKKTEIR
jgi:hypothetical protein